MKLLLFFFFFLHFQFYFLLGIPIAFVYHARLA